MRNESAAQLDHAPQPDIIITDEQIVALRPNVVAFLRKVLAKEYNRIDVADLAEDIAQTALMKAIVKKNQYRGESTLLTWINTIALNTARSKMKHSSISRELLQKSDDEDSPKSEPASKDEGVEDTNDRARLRQTLNALIRQLPKGSRGVVELYYGDDQPTLEEVAARLGIAVGTVKSQLSKARAKLRELAVENDISLEEFLDKP